MLNELRARVRQLSDPAKAQTARRYFKTGPGQYGEGDVWVGLAAATLRRLAAGWRTLSLDDCWELLRSEVHEERALALLILVDAYRRSKNDAVRQAAIYEGYLAHTAHINNWDLVDVSAPHIVGAHLWDKDRQPLCGLARAESLWERRIAIVATQFFIRRNDFADTLTIAGLLLSDRADLIHKAVGWMLREVGQRDLQAEQNFLRQHYHAMPRTMLRYAIERFPEDLRQKYLRGEIN